MNLKKSAAWHHLIPDGKEREKNALHRVPLPGAAVVAQQHQQGTQQLVGYQGNPGAFQAHAQYIDAEDGQTRTNQEHG